jgi:hypothetical protein
VQNPVDPVAQEETAYDKEREQPTSRPAKEAQDSVLPDTINHYAHILASITLD